MLFRSLWEGLGYYSRCRNLLNAARAMVSEGFSLPPPDVEKLRSYPGIGSYTAGAVTNVAYNLPVPAVDGNAERVIARLCDVALPAGSGALRRRVAAIVSGMIPEGGARALNQGVDGFGGGRLHVPLRRLSPMPPDLLLSRGET